MFTIQQRRLEAAQRWPGIEWTFSASASSSSICKTMLRIHVNWTSHAIRPYAHCSVFHSVCCYTSGFRFAPLESLCLHYYGQIRTCKRAIRGYFDWPFRPRSRFLKPLFALDLMDLVYWRWMKNDRRRSTNESARGKIASHACAVYEDTKRYGIFSAFFYLWNKFEDGSEKKFFDQDFWSCLKIVKKENEKILSLESDKIKLPFFKFIS